MRLTRAKRGIMFELLRSDEDARLEGREGEFEVVARKFLPFGRKMEKP